LINITKEQYEAIYTGLDVPPYELFHSSPKSDQDLWLNMMSSKLWRLNNLYTITNKDGELVRFVMNFAQHIVYAATLRHPRVIVLKSRQQGISTLWLVSYFDDSVFEENFEIGLMTQGIKESKTLFRRVKRLWEELPTFVKEFLNLEMATDTKEEIGLSNGSTMYIQTSFRSGTLQRLHISEFGKIAAKYPEKALETKTGTLQTIRIGNTVVIESTAETGDNEFKNMWDIAEGHVGQLTGKDFTPIFLSWADDPDCNIDVEQVISKSAQEYFDYLEEARGSELRDHQKWWWVAQKRELEDEMGREYPGTAEEAFEVARDGSYYGSLYRDHVRKQGKLVTGLYDNALDVHVAMDLGMNDTFSVVFFQIGHDRSVRLIDEYHNSGEGLSHYVGQIYSRGYDIADVYVPHDAMQRDLNTNMTRVARLRELGVNNIRLLPRVGVAIGIERVRSIITSGKLWVDSEKCEYLDKAFRNYTKQWDSKLGQWKEKPLHNEWSNPADAIRYMAMSGASGSVATNVSAKSKKKARRRTSNVVDGMAI